MTARIEPRRETLTRVAVAIALSVALFGAGVAGRGMLADESAQAHAYVVDGQRALAQGDRAAGVLSLERARWLAPREHLVRAAIEGAGVNEAEPVIPRAARLLTSREWSAIATTFGWISGLAIAFAVVRWHRRYAVRAALAAACAFVIGMAGTMESNASAPGVVTGGDTQLLVAPYSNAVAEKALPAGTMVLVGPGYDAFVHVKASDGESGWVPRDRVEAIAGSEG
jgi:hypothetical protein